MLLSLRAIFCLSFCAFQVKAFDATTKHGPQVIVNARQLEQNNKQIDIFWMPNYSIKFKQCHSLIQVAGGEGQNNKNEADRQLYTQHLIEFSLCPSNSCSSGCQNGGKYITNMREFTRMYMEYKKEAKEQACEQIRQNCYNDDDNLCFYQAGMEDCIENQNEGNNNNREEDIDRYLECQELDMGNNNGNNKYNYNNNGGGYMYRQYYVGPKCSSNGKSITLGLFLDAGCSVPTEDGLYEKITGGYSLPYSKQSMIQNDCISCKETDENENNNNNNNNKNNQNQEANVIEMCERTYENAGKCEESMSIYYPDNSACQFINELLPKMENALKASITADNISHGVPIVLALVFGIMSAMFALYSFLLYRRLRRRKSQISLNSPSDGVDVA